jgi:hypothetical protein
MRQGQQNRRGRNRGRKPQNSVSRNYESSGPDVKIRGTAMHIAEKYASLARDAMSSGDQVAAENYLQHAEHYNRIILAAQAQNPVMPGIEGQNGMNGSGRFNQSEPFQGDYDGDGDDGEAEDFPPQHRGFHDRHDNQQRHDNQRNFRERPDQRNFQDRSAYNQHQQPQPYIPQNAFPHAQPPMQPVPVANGTVVHGGENFAGGPDGERIPRRRRRRPIPDMQGKPFQPRNGGGHAEGTGGGGSDPTPDDSAS